MVRFVMTVLVGLALTQGALARGQAGDVLTNDDVIKMVRAQLSTNIILTTIRSANAKFDLSPSGLIALKDAGVSEEIIEAMLARGPSRESKVEKSELLSTSKNPDDILRTFKTIFVDASKAVYFKTPQMKAALGDNKDFRALNLSIVDDQAVADAVLEVNHTFAWDYPFSLRHQNTSVVLVSGKGNGPFSGPLGARSVASELVKQLKPYRAAPPPPKPAK
jgi:hypothetical protein